MIVAAIVTLSTNVTASSLMPQHIDSLYAEADFVGYITIVASEFRRREIGRRSEVAIVMKAKIEQVFRGDSTDHFIYFGRFSGHALGSTYLVFLKRSGKTVAERLHRLHHEGNPRFDTVSSQYYLIMFEGFGSMETENYVVSLVLPGRNNWESGQGVKISTRYVLIPDSLRAVSITTADDSLWGNKWIGGQELTSYLAGLHSRIPATSSLPSHDQPREVWWGCFNVHDLAGGRSVDSAVAASLNTSLRRQLRALFGRAFEQLLQQSKVTTKDSSKIAKHRSHWRGPTAVQLVQYNGGPDSGFASVCLLLATTPSGNILDSRGAESVDPIPLIGLGRLHEIISREDPPDGVMTAELSNVTLRGPLIWRVVIKDEETTFKEIIFLVDARTGEVLDAYDSIQAYHVW